MKKEDRKQKQLQERKEELKKELEKRIYILATAKQCLLFAKDLRFSNDEKLNNFLQSSAHFRFIHTALWKQSVIELAKLFSNSDNTQKFNIHRLISQLENSGHYACLKFSKVAIQSWRDKITQSESKIKVVLDLRDKLYAHTDPKPEVNILDVPTFEEVEQLIQIIEDIIQEIEGTVFDTGFTLDDLPHYDDRFVKMLKELADYRYQKPLKWLSENGDSF